MQPSLPTNLRSTAPLPLARSCRTPQLSPCISPRAQTTTEGAATAAVTAAAQTQRAEPMDDSLVGRRDDHTRQLQASSTESMRCQRRMQSQWACLSFLAPAVCTAFHWRAQRGPLAASRFTPCLHLRRPHDQRHNDQSPIQINCTRTIAAHANSTLIVACSANCACGLQACNESCAFMITDID